MGSRHDRQRSARDKLGASEQIVRGRLPITDKLARMSVFASVVDCGGFSAAAAKLGVSKSLASQYVTELEKALGVKLLNRTTRRVHTTESGEVFYRHCREMLRAAEQAESSVARMQSEPEGRLRLTAEVGFATRHLLPAANEFQARYPRVTIEMMVTSRVVDLVQEGVDLAVRITERPAENVVARKLADNRLVLCASPAYLARHGTPRTLEDLGQHSCLLFPVHSHGGKWKFIRGGHAQAVPVPARLVIDDIEGIRYAVLSGLGLGILPTFMAGADIRAGELKPVLQQYRVVGDLGIYLVWLPSRFVSRKVRAFVDFLVARFGPVPYWDLP